MDEKKYTEGEVKISAREYRDLIEAAKDAEAVAAEKSNEYYRIYSEKRELERKVEDLEKTIRAMKGEDN